MYQGQLYRQFEKSEETVTFHPILPDSMREDVLRDFHEGAVGGHLGTDKLFGVIQEQFYLPGYHNDVSEWVKRCSVCAMRKSPAPRNHRAPLQSVQYGYPMQLVPVDILGPLPESDAGNSYILTVADYFTRWMEAYPIPN